jgi:hypothetical protein
VNAACPNTSATTAYSSIAATDAPPTTAGGIHGDERTTVVPTAPTP